MQEINALLTQDSFRFWGTVIIVLTIFFVIRKNIKKKLKITRRVIVKEDILKPEVEILNQKNTLIKEQLKDCEKVFVKDELKVEEPKTNYVEPVIQSKEDNVLLSKKQVQKYEKIPPYDQMTEKQKIRYQALSRALTTFKEQQKTLLNQNFLFTKYSVDFQNINSYPLVRLPKPDTIVRSYKLGKAKRRGFKEESFQKSIEQYFGDEFIIVGNARLNTGKETRPFEPDIAIVDKSNVNLRIDVEIDEPYAGITRQPTHCKGDDVSRDLYFVDRGWVVIRFSEYQVHTQEKGCLKFIAEIIKSTIPEYEIPNLLINESSLEFERFWDIVQAQKWEKINYRESYLNHTFKYIEESEEKIERDFDEKELEEEKLVKPTLIGKIDDRKATLFNLQNIHSRDRRIKFYPEPHVYTIDNVPAPSVSTIIGKFFPEFDSVYWSRKKAFEKLKAENKELSELNIQKTANLIEKEWKEKGEKAAQEGTYLHEQIEAFYLNQDYNRTEEFHLFENFVNENNQIKPYKTEWRIFDEEYHIAGTIDLISENRNGYEIYDWKRSKKVVSSNTGEPIKNNKWQRGVGQLAYIDDTSYNRYCLQQSLYKYILEKNYGVKVLKMYLIVLYPEYDNYFKIEVPYLKNEIEYILKAL